VFVEVYRDRWCAGKSGRQWAIHVSTAEASMGTSALRAKNLTKRYGRLLALDGLDPAVEAGEVSGFPGPNGAGKSTTTRLLLGMARPIPGRPGGVLAVPRPDPSDPELT
jgi:ATPase subunit of ABC transporter with duplicated ATPase domains